MNILFIGNGFDLQHKDMKPILFFDFIEWGKTKSNNKNFFKKNFNDEDYLKNFNKKDSLWSDLENYLLTIERKNKSLFYKNLNKHFETWIIEIKKDINYNNVSKDLFIQNILNKSQIDLIISLNYTDTPKLYNFKETFFSEKENFSNFTLKNYINHYINLHYFKSNKKHNFILGNDNEKKHNKNYLISKWEGKSNFNPKNIILKSIIKENIISKIIFYGFSFGDSDKEIILFLFNLFKKNQNLLIIIYVLNKEFQNEIIRQIRKNLKYKNLLLIFLKKITFIFIENLQ